MPLPLPVIPARPIRTPLESRLTSIRDELLAMGAARSAEYFELSRFDRILKTTISLCPKCLAHVPAITYTLENRVLLRKRCPADGLSTALIENDAGFYRLSNKDRWGRRFADDMVMDIPAYEGECCSGDACGGDAEPPSESDGDFTGQLANKSCTVLVEVTNACNLACAVCYSDARGDRKMPLALFKQYMLRLVEQKGGLDSVQLTGGEALLHPEFWEMLAFLHSLDGVKRIYLPTNGILLSRGEQAQRLAPFKSKLMVLLQFDGRDTPSNSALRNANTVRLRQQVIEHLQALGIYMQLTMTIAQGVNDHEIGWVVDMAMRHSIVKVAALQPVTYSGRYDLEPDPMHRLTLSDVAKAVVAQAQKRMTGDQFVPIPCSHPNCGWITLFARRFGCTFNIVKHMDMSRAINQASYKTILSTSEIRGIVGGNGASPVHRIVAAMGRKLIRARDVVGIAIKPFMDRFSYDQDRISACCHHLLDTQGRAVSFCEYNARLRPGDSWEGFPELRTGIVSLPAKG